jgi:putative peptide modification system cyclase
VNVAETPEGDLESQASSLLRTLLLCDLVDSTGLVERLGDREAAELIRKHDRLARTLADRHGGREIDKTDGFMMMFKRPVQAVAFALDYQRGLRQLNAVESADLRARVGIHVGDVVVWDNTAEDIARGAKPVEVEGLVKPITSRLMGLALPGQILLSNIAYDLAHRAEGELGELLATARWRTHGRYRFRGTHEPVAVFEVGEEGLAPLKAPPWSSKAHREVPFWRRPATVVMEVLLLVVLIAIPAVMFLKPDPAIAFAKRDWVVVGSLHNLTGETLFDDALENALRIGLEQSRYVNVMPDLKVRDTITRMQRDPDKTEVDREVGSEIAIRDGARALILPTIAEIGGRVRITAEVIDPQTQTTVYSETADGIGKESILPSLDTINSRLRVRLGEALATVSSESRSLEKVSTRNLDALKAYSQALEVNVAGDAGQSLVLFENAIALDPGFARARIDMAIELINQGRRADAREQLDKAMLLSDRLTPRDKLAATALLAEFESTRRALQEWKALAVSYPDYFQAQGTYGYYAWLYANNFVDAIQATRQNAVEQNPHRGTGLYLLGTLLTGMEKYPEAEKMFLMSESVGTKFQNQYFASMYAAQREYKKAAAVLARGRPNDTAVDQLNARIAAISISLDQGKWKESAAESTAIPMGLKPLTPAMNLMLGDTALGARVILDPGSAFAPAPGSPANMEAERSQTASNSDPDATQWNASALFRAWLASRYVNDEAAMSQLKRMSKEIDNDENPILSKLSKLVNIQRALSSGRIDESMSMLSTQHDGTELYATHLLLMETLAKAGDIAAARNEARWLSSHRGRAYTQISVLFFKPFDIAQSNLANLYEAEFSFQLGDHEDARRSLDRFRKYWPTDNMPAWISRRIGALEQALEKSTASASQS